MNLKDIDRKLGDMMKEEKIVNKHLDIPFKDFMPGQIIQSSQFNDDMLDIEEKVNEIIDKHNLNVNKLHEHLDDKENPHEVNPHQIGTYEGSEIDAFVDDVKNGNLNDEAITNRVLADACVDNRVLIDGVVTLSKLDTNIGNQIDISNNMSIKERYTKLETDAIIQEKVGDGTYSKEQIDAKFEEYQAGTIVDGTIDITKLKGDVGRKLDIEHNPSISNRYTKSQVNALIAKNGLPKDWGNLTDEVDDEIVTQSGLGSLPVSDVMVCGEFKATETDVLNVKIQDVEFAKGEFNTLEERLDNVDTQLAHIAILDDNVSTLQDLIDKASQTTHYLKLSPKTYIVGCLKPRSNVKIDLNGATLKLADNTDLPLFYEVDNTISNFEIINGVLDLNKTHNNLVNQSGGGVWINNSNNLKFSNLKVVNAFRSIFNFYTCDNVRIKDVECIECGMENSNNFYTYGASFENNCNNIEIDNFRMINIYGYGIHIRQSNQVKISNIYFNNFTRKGYSIGITLTDSNNVDISNYKHEKGDYLGIECNHSNNVNFNNIVIDKVVTPMVFGDNGSGEFNNFIKINNLTTKNTSGAISLNLNYLNNLIIENFDLDKNFSTAYDIKSKNIFLENGKINTEMSTIHNYDRFNFKNVKFNSVNINNYNEKHKNDFYLNAFHIDTDSSTNINLKSLLGIEYYLFGKMLVYSCFASNNAQASCTEYNIIISNNVYIKEVSNVDGSYARKVTVTTDGNNLIFTNNTGVKISVNIKFY